MSKPAIPALPCRLCLWQLACMSQCHVESSKLYLKVTVTGLQSQRCDCRVHDYAQCHRLWFVIAEHAQMWPDHNTARHVVRHQHECDVSAVLDNLDQTPLRVAAVGSPTQTMVSPDRASFEPGSSQVTATSSDGGGGSEGLEAGGADASTPSRSRCRGETALDSGRNPAAPGSSSVPTTSTGAGGACAAPKMASDAVSTQKDARHVVASEHSQSGPSPRNALTTNHFLNAGRRRVSPCQVGVGVKEHSRYVLPRTE